MFINGGGANCNSNPNIVHCWSCFEDLKLSISNYAHMSLDFLFPNLAVPTTEIPQ